MKNPRSSSKTSEARTAMSPRCRDSIRIGMTSFPLIFGARAPR
jgi:hypothetical protein